LPSRRASITARHFSINTDINTLISADLDWRKRDNQFEQAFDRDRTILAVVDAPTPELTRSAVRCWRRGWPATPSTSIPFSLSVPESF